MPANFARCSERSSAKDNIEISHVVSSLPLRSLPEKVVTNIIREVYAVLPKEGKLVQYTYNLGKTSHPCLSGFKRYPHRHHLGQRAARPSGRISEERRLTSRPVVQSAGLDPRTEPSRASFPRACRRL